MGWFIVVFRVHHVIDIIEAVAEIAHLFLDIHLGSVRPVASIFASNLPLATYQFKGSNHIDKLPNVLPNCLLILVHAGGQVFAGRVDPKEVHCGQEPNHLISRKSVQVLIHVVPKPGKVDCAHTKVRIHAAGVLLAWLVTAEVVFVASEVATEDLASFQNGPEMNLHGGVVVVVVCFLVALDLIL